MYAQQIARHLRDDHGVPEGMLMQIATDVAAMDAVHDKDHEAERGSFRPLPMARPHSHA